MLHGIPGTEQNFDVAYALRDVGFNCLLWHYRGYVMCVCVCLCVSVCMW
jgi:hypothetical protein